MSQDSQQQTTAEMFVLPDGTYVNKFCMGQFNDFLMNIECIWDILDVVTKLIRVDVIKDENGFVKDVELIVPRIDEVLTKLSMKNFVKMHEERGDSMSADTVLELRRLRLEKMVNKEQR